MTAKIGNGSIPLRIGRLIDTTVYGGPYKQVPELFWGVKMAEEISHPHMVDIPTKDYCVPAVSVLKRGIVKALMAMINEEDVYAGCWGGIGRTGIFLAALAKVQIEYRKAKHRPGRGEDPVLYVRKHFIPHAVETKQQEEFIANLDVSDIVEWLNMTQTVMGLGGLTPSKQTFREEINATENGKAWEGRRVEVPSQSTNIGHQHTAGIVKKPWVAEADKIENPAFDFYEAEWKAKRDSRKIDWMDSPDADSADENIEAHGWEPAITDLQEQVDDLERHIMKIHKGCQDGFAAADENFKTLGLEEYCEHVPMLEAEGSCSKCGKDLTKPTFIGRLRSLFK